MLRDEYFQRLTNGAHVDLYLSANDGARLWWPWRMQPPREASRRYRDSCASYIIDSHIADPSVTTEQCLNTAFRLEADIVALVDYMPFEWYEGNLDKADMPTQYDALEDLRAEFDSAYTATLYSLTKGLDIINDHSFQGDVLIPLQEPWVECWEDLGRPTDHMLGIGGLKESSPDKRLEAVKDLRNAAGEDVWIHGFGWGVKGLAEPIRKEPNLLDSLDYSTPMQNAAINDSSPGKERMSVAAMDAAQRLIRDLREVSEWPDEITPESLRETDQQGMSAFQ